MVWSWQVCFLLPKEWLCFTVMGHKPWDSWGVLELSWSRYWHMYVFMSIRNCVLCHGWLCRASHPCICICLLGSVGLPVHRSSASPLPLMWVYGAGLVVLLYSQNTVDCLRKWAQWLWCPLSKILIGTLLGSSQLHELSWGLHASASCTHGGRRTHWATHIYRSAFYKNTDPPAFSRDSCLDLTPITIVYWQPGFGQGVCHFSLPFPLPQFSHL